MEKSQVHAVASLIRLHFIKLHFIKLDFIKLHLDVGLRKVIP
jgi:hypothetical protein